MRARELRHWQSSRRRRRVGRHRLRLPPLLLPQPRLLWPRLLRRSCSIAASELAPRFVAKHGTDVEQINDFWFYGWESSGWQKIATLLLFYNGA